MRTRSLRFAFALLVAIAGNARAQNACPGTWSKPVPLTRDGAKPVYVERGIVSELGGRALAIGAPTLFWLGRDQPVPADLVGANGQLRAGVDTADVIWSFSRGGAFIDSAGISAGVPMVDTAAVRVSPRLFARATNSIVALWETADSVSRKGGSMNAQRIETSSFDGKAWSKPDVALRADHLTLGPVPSVRQGVPFDLLSFAVTSTDSGHPRVHVVRHRAGRWADVLVPDVSFAGFFGAYSPDAERTTLIAMGGVVPGRSGLYVTNGRWTDDTATWSKPVMIDSLSGGYSPFSWARLGRDSVVLVWTQEGGPMKTSISADGGATWKNVMPLETKTVMGSQVLAVDGAGRLHVVFNGPGSTVLNAPGAILHSMWIGGRWTTPDTISTTESLWPTVGGAFGGRLMATWGDIVATSLGPSPKSLASFWSPECPRR